MCDCCHQDKEETVLSSGYGPITVAECPECRSVGRVPYSLLLHDTWSNFPSDWKEKKEYLDDISYQLNLHKIKLEEFEEDLRKLESELHDDLEKLNEELKKRE